MPIFDTIPNSATTLSVNYRPGQNKRLFSSKSEAIFSFGDFTIENNYTLNQLTGYTRSSQFGTFDNLQTLSAANFSNDSFTFSVQHNELNLPKRNPKSHAYFSSFYTNVATSINTIIENFPYAILSHNGGNTNIFDYTEYFNGITLQKTSSFKIPVSGLTNQGNIALASGNTEETYSLSYEYDEFCIQLSATTSAKTEVFTIKDYSFSGTYLYFEVYGFLMSSGTATYENALYIRPTKERMFNYNDSITALETQLLNEGIFLIPAIDTTADDSFEKTFTWPRTIDGFSPDSYGTDFEDYKENILAAAEKVDQEKTDIFIKTVIPENYTELDSDNEIYRTIIQTYAYEFDKLKNYIDAMAYAHSIEYNNEETVPKKFLTKLGSLLGWKLSEGFSELDLFDYLTSDLDENSNSFSYFNLEIWRRILINLVWLYKKKGTRDAIMFIFRLIGAPDSLIKFDEFVYDIAKTTPILTGKVDTDGYINYATSDFIFQEGGDGRGNGDAYINQWRPEFDPVMRVDNNKIQTGDTTGGTRSIVNTKEIDLAFSPAQAIETDVWEFYQQSGACCQGQVGCTPALSLSCLTVPSEYLSFTCDDACPVNITAMTLNQYIDYVYTNSIDPTNRKTNAQCHTTWSYPELKNIYLTYYYATCPPDNHHLTMCRLESYLQLLEMQMGDYILQLIPATTIFDDSVASLYKNTVFHRQRFVYKEGVDKGSMFRRNFPDEIQPGVGYSFVNTATICVFAGHSNLSSGALDITGNSWRVEKNIPAGNICPSAKNIANKTSGRKIDTITTKSGALSPIKVTCSINKNKLSTGIDAVNISNVEVNEMSQNLISEEIFDF